LAQKVGVWTDSLRQVVGHSDNVVGDVRTTAHQLDGR
jgi:hypothetical protein